MGNEEKLHYRIGSPNLSGKGQWTVIGEDEYGREKYRHLCDDREGAFEALDWLRGNY